MQKQRFALVGVFGVGRVCHPLDIFFLFIIYYLSSMDQETQECCNYNAKNQFIQKFTKEVIKAGKRFDKTACERQKFLYHDVYITWLDKCPRTYTMRDIRSMHYAIKDSMECDCKEEADDKNFRDIFANLSQKLETFVEEELDYNSSHQCACQPSAALGLGDPNSEIGKQLCEKGRLYFDRSVFLGLMNKDYTWVKSKKLTQKQIAYWVSLFAKTMDIAEPWSWAMKIWPEYKFLTQYYNKVINNDDLNDPEYVFIERIFI